MTGYSVMTPFMPTRSEQILPLASLVAHSTARRLWQGQALLIDPYQTFSFAAASGFHVPVGMGVALMPFRHPFDAALSARSLAATTGQGVVAGFGPGAALLQQAVLGETYASPLQAVREYLTIVGGLVRGEAVDLAGEYFRCHFQLAGPVVPGVEVGAGVLRPRMARVAGAVADVAITWMTPPDYLSGEIAPQLAVGAAEADRPVPRVVSVVPVCTPGPGIDPVETFLAGSSGHLRLPHYQDMLRRGGVAVDPDDPVKTVRSGMEQGVFVYGTADEMPDRMAPFADAGVEEIVLNCTGVSQRHGYPAALHTLGTVLEALR